MEDIVVAGISGRLPESNNLEEFWQNLFNGVDMVTEDDRRWKPGMLTIFNSNNFISFLIAFRNGLLSEGHPGGRLAYLAAVLCFSLSVWLWVL